MGKNEEKNIVGTFQKGQALLGRNKSFHTSGPIFSSSNSPLNISFSCDYRLTDYTSNRPGIIQ